MAKVRERSATTGGLAHTPPTAYLRTGRGIGKETKTETELRPNALVQTIYTPVVPPGPLYPQALQLLRLRHLVYHRSITSFAYVRHDASRSRSRDANYDPPPKPPPPTRAEYRRGVDVYMDYPRPPHPETYGHPRFSPRGLAAVGGVYIMVTLEM
ncbi:hypothetical protein BT96DRAFT_991775 [Gymnopus androsaceus JB14]|uniref:Uncharacterized protein n=1 Tax=Gymnopus androsaceus JB14 TaxID=1447944 RepID=A0A6A4HYE3_9AGAR|nr:hypothetical protein BT96DRAFT_991775 [Gymnopus androsaceus JB14]